MILSVDLGLAYETVPVFNQIVIKFGEATQGQELPDQNIIKIVPHQDTFQITLQGNLKPSQIETIWQKFLRDADLPEDTVLIPDIDEEEASNKEKDEKTDLLENGEIKADLIPSTETEALEELPREEIVDFLFKTNLQKGFSIDKGEMWNFVENYKQKFGHYLLRKDMESVGIGYIKKLNQEMGMPLKQKDIENLEHLTTPEPKDALHSIPSPDTLEKPKETAEDPLPQKKTIAAKVEQLKKAKALEEKLVQAPAESPKYHKVSLTQKQDNILVISKPEGRRKCPNCQESNPHMIHESVDKTVLISHYPRIYGKKFKCGNCGLVWREE